jgi:hypothetical protein
MLAGHNNARAPPAAHSGHETRQPSTSISVHYKNHHICLECFFYGSNKKPT